MLMLDYRCALGTTQMFPSAAASPTEGSTTERIHAFGQRDWTGQDA